MKKLIICSMLVFIGLPNFAQFYYCDSAWTKMVNYSSDSIDIERKTFFTTLHDYDMNISGMQIFSLYNDTIDGFFFEINSEGQLVEWVEYKKGKLWNVYKLYDTLDYGKIIKGSGFINCYWPKQFDSNNPNNKENEIYQKVYYEDGVLSGYVEFFDKGEIYGFSQVESKGKPPCRNPQFSHFFRDTCGNRIEKNVILYGYCFCCGTDYDTIFYMDKGYFVSGYDLLSEESKGAFLKPQDFYIPERFYTKKRERILRKFQKKLIPIYNKYGFIDIYFINVSKYYSKYFEKH